MNSFFAAVGGIWDTIAEAHEASQHADIPRAIAAVANNGVKLAQATAKESGAEGAVVAWTHNGINLAQNIAKTAEIHAPLVAAAAAQVMHMAVQEGAKQVEIHRPAVEAVVGNGVQILKENLDGEKLKEHAETAAQWMKENPGKTALIAGGAVLVVAPGIVTQPALAMAGFGSEGVAAGSLAAGVQSGIGNVVAGSAFAGLQSAGAGGAGAAVLAAAVQIPAAVAVGMTVADAMKQK